MLKKTITTLAFASVVALAAASASAQQPKDIKWGTGPAGSTGGKALVTLSNILNKQMPEYRVTVLPTPGAVGTVKGFAMGELDAYYGSDVALKEFSTDSGRFKGFKAHAKRTPVQSFWSYTLDVGIAIKAANRDKIKSWADLAGKPVYTGPLPFDTRRHLENALAALGVKHIYREVDLATAGSQLDDGGIQAMIIYVAGGTIPPPWLSQASLAVEWVALNPSPEEIKKLEAAGFGVDVVPPEKLKRTKEQNKEIALLPFYWGFDVGMNIPENDTYKMLTIIEKNADDLGKLDPSFRQIAGGKMADFQAKALKTTWKLVPIHPGLAKYLREKGKWNKEWDSNLAKSGS